MRLEMLLGRPVVATNGRKIGRIEEVRAEVRGGSAVVGALCIGPHALLERLSAPVTSRWGRRTGHVARIDQIDLSDPLRPRLLVPVAQLDRL